jgi:serine phosphatase RsbU (regulator of sigma subunit)
MSQMREDFAEMLDYIKSEQNIKAKVEKLLDLVLEMFFANDLSHTLELLRYGEAICQAENYELGAAQIRVRLASYYYFAADLEKALSIFQEGLVVLEKYNDKKAMAESLPFLSMLQWSIGNYAESLKHSTKAVSLFEEIDDKKRFPLALNSLATQYFDLKDYEKSAHYYHLAVAVNKSVDVETSRYLARSYIGLAGIFMVQKNFKDAEKYLLLAVELQDTVKDNYGKARSLNDLAKIQKETGNLDAAMNFYVQTIKLREGFLDKNPLITSYLDLGELYLDNDYFEEAKEYFEKAYDLAVAKSAKSKIWRAHELFSRLYKKLRNFEKALLHHEKFVEIKESVLGDEASLKVKNMQSKFESEKAEKEAEIYRLKNVELKSAYSVIEEQNKNIIDSINYAKRIQNALLPEPKKLKTVFSDAFVFWQPRDIVSGDFYWFADKKAYDNDIFGDFGTESGLIIAAADCTGHGVPGALMSVMGINFLEEIVLRKHITAPNLILDELNRSLKALLRNEENNVRDGMDISVLRVTNDKKRVDFAGAMNGMLLVFEDENGEKRTKYFEPDKKSIGGTQKGESFEYKCESFSFDGFNKPVLYLYTDGYADQFGGSEKRKFMRKNLFEILKNMSNLALDLQRELLEQTISDWMREGGEKQTDDMLILGLKI